MTGGWFTLTELQERLNLEDRRCLRESLRSAGLPMSNIGREVYIREAAWLEWLEANETTTHAPRCGGDVHAERIDVT